MSILLEAAPFFVLCEGTWCVIRPNSMSMPLLKTKLDIPPTRAKLLSRPRLIERLKECSGHKLTVICAPAGYGKTTALSQWAAGCNHPIAWFSLDPSDNDPTHFWTYFISALRSRVGGTGQASLRMLRSSAQPPIETVLTVLINDISSWQEECLLVIDDYHLITNKEIHDAFAFLLEHLPQRIHLILSTRIGPDLPLSRLRVRGELHELRSSDFRFSPSETEDFLKIEMGLDLSSEQLATLDERTEGWIAGLQLAAISLKGRSDPSEFIESFDGTQEYILRYLVEEVLQQQPKEVQSFLLNSSILDRMSGSLCAYITGWDESPAMLETLYAANLFVFPLDTERNWYRYHRLFQEALQNRLRRIRPRLIPELHIRASRWYEDSGYMSDAIHHAFMGEDFERAATLIERHCMPTFHRGETTTVLNWLDRLPEAMIRTRPMICVAQAYVALMDPSAGPSHVVEQRLGDAERVVLARLKEEGAHYGEIDRSCCDQVIGYIASMRAHLARDRGAPPESIIELSSRALENVRGEDHISRGLLLMNLAMAYRALGDIDAASSALEETRRIGERCDLPLSAVYSAYLLAQIARLQGRLDSSIEICKDALGTYDSNQGASGQPLPVIGALHVCLGTILVERDEQSEADRLLKRGVELLKIMRDLDALLNGYAARVRLATAQGWPFSDVVGLIEEMESLGTEPEAFGAALRIRLLTEPAHLSRDSLSAAALLAQKHRLDLRSSNHIPGIDHISQRRSALDFALVRLFIAQRRFSPGAQGQLDLGHILSFLDLKLKEAEECDLLTRIVETKILMALARQARGEPEGALQEIAGALSHSEPVGFVRLFVDEGAPMAQLLRTAIARGLHQDYAARLWERIRKEGKERHPNRSEDPGQGSLVEPISVRELQVLRLLAAGLSNREIAEELSLAVGTVKKHIYNIYGKLSVAKRTQAVAKARSLSLL